MNPRLSVVMRVYDAAPYLAEALDSILGQTFRDFELIVVDDGSTDGSGEIIRSYKASDRRIRAFFEPHAGQASAGNLALSKVRGAFVAHMDGDDIALPERFAHQIQRLESTTVDVCGGQVEVFGELSRLWWYPEDHHAILSELTFRYAMLQGSAMMRAEVARDNPYVPGASADDYELLTRLALRYEMANLPQVVLRHRRHRQQIHVVRQQSCLEDFARYRLRYVYERFPETPLAEYVALARMAEGHAMNTLSDLQIAGQWLLRLSEPQDRRLRQQMAKRWLGVCQLSADLGPDVSRLRDRIGARLDVLIAGA